MKNIKLCKLINNKSKDDANKLELLYKKIQTYTMFINNVKYLKANSLMIGNIIYNILITIWLFAISLKSDIIKSHILQILEYHYMNDKTVTIPLEQNIKENIKSFTIDAVDSVDDFYFKPNKRQIELNEVFQPYNNQEIEYGWDGNAND